MYAICTDKGDLAGFRNLRIRACHALDQGQRYILPRLKDLLALEELTPLCQFLDSRQADLSILQGELDRLVDVAHEEAEV